MNFGLPIRVVSLVFALSGAGVVSAAPASPEAGFSVGQKIEVSFLGKWLPATVVSTDGVWPKVHFVDGNGRDHEQVMPPTRIHSLGGNTGAPNLPNQSPPGAAAAPATAPAVAAAPSGQTPRVKPMLELTQGDWSAIVDVTPAGAAAPAQAPADPVTWAQAPADKRINLKTRNSDDVFERMGALFFADKVPQAVVTYVNAVPGKDPSWRIERADLAHGTSLGVSAPVAGDLNALALSPDASRLFAIARDGAVGLNENAQIWTTDPKSPLAGPQLLLAWKPYAAEQSLDRQITWAGFVDSDHVFTASQGGKVVLWQVAAGKARAVSVAKVALWSTPALSGGRKYLALPTEKSLFFLDPMTGKVLARLDAASLTRAVISFRPDGKQVAAVMPGRLIVWDLAAGGAAPVCDFSSNRATGGSLAWASDGFVVLDSKYLLDLSRSVILWTYRLSERGGAELIANSVGRFWYIAEPTHQRGAAAVRAAAAGSASPVLVSAVLPDDAVRKVTAGLKEEDITLLKPGSKVSLAVNVDAPDDVKQKITNALTAGLKANGMTVADDAPVKLEATTTPGDSQEITYRVGFQEQKANVTGTVYRLAFTADGQTAWERVSKTSPPMMLQIKAGQTAQQAVDAARQPNYGFFLNAALPRVVPKPGEKPGFGESKLTAEGPQAITPRVANP